MTRFADQTKSLAERVAEYDKDPSLDPEQSWIAALCEGMDNAKARKDADEFGSKKKPKSQFSP